MSDTPRTDTIFELEMLAQYNGFANLCRQLERELATAKLKYWREGMSEASEIARKEEWPQLGRSDEIHPVSKAILAARDAKGETK